MLRNWINCEVIGPKTLSWATRGRGESSSPPSPPPRVLTVVGGSTVRTFFRKRREKGSKTEDVLKKRIFDGSGSGSGPW
jgi:hypothetical protein